MDSLQETIRVPSKIKTEMLFGEFLISKDLLTRQELIDALNEQRDNPGRLGEVLVRMKKLSSEDVTCALAEHLSIDYAQLDDVSKINMEVARILPESIARRFCLAVIGEMDDKIIVAMTDPLNVVAIDTITLKIRRQIKIVISSPEAIRKAIEAVYHGSDLDQQQLRNLVETEVDTDGSVESDLVV